MKPSPVPPLFLSHARQFVLSADALFPKVEQHEKNVLRVLDQQTKKIKIKYKRISFFLEKVPKPK